MKRLMLPAAIALGLCSTPALAEGDADKGKRVFNKCKACHMVGEDAKNRVGPVLNGVVDRAAGQVDFKYSPALMAAAEDGLVWDAENLSVFLTKPKDLIKGTKMSFAGLRKEQDILDVIAYLETFE